jgi:signal transduction histidine kinase
MPGSAALPRNARPVARAAWRGLVQVLADSDPPASRRRRSPGQGWAVGAALAVVTLLLYAASLVSLFGGSASHQEGGRGHLGPGSPGGISHGSLSGSGQGAAVFSVFDSSHLPLVAQSAVQAVIVMALMAPLPLSFRYPLLSWRIGWLGLLLIPLLKYPWWGGLPWDPVQILVLLVAACAAGIRQERTALCWLWALTLIPWWLWACLDGVSVVAAGFGSVAFGAMAVAVDSVSSRRQAQQALADQAERAELEQARRAVLEGRARIARELHDVVAHHMSLIAVRAETAPYRIVGLPEPALEEFGWLSGSAREAMADMRRLLAMLRSDQLAARVPQPGLPDLPALVDTARQAGMAVELSASGGLDMVPESAGVCAYRIVQEALSNAGRHAAGTPVTVSVQHDAETVTLQVANGPGTAKAGVNGHAPGHGLAGMRERAELLGGSLSAGTVPDGGFVVSAVLPLTGPTA